jgi:MinD-like ATPase involved in chromosome partitioning or flagellar assembly
LDLPTYTNIWRIEKRLYKLYDFRLPMPIPVGQIAVFTAITVPYVVILKVAGLPFSHTLLWLYILPPGVVTWLVSRPVLEGKRLPELIHSQIRYLFEPRTWCRMAPLAERDHVVLVARVWRRAAPLPAKATVRQVARQPAVRRVADVPVVREVSAAREVSAVREVPVVREAPAREVPMVREVPATGAVPVAAARALAAAAPAASGLAAATSAPASAAAGSAPASAGPAPASAGPAPAAASPAPPPAPARPAPARPGPPPRARPTVTVAGDQNAERPLPVVERALSKPPERGETPWRNRVVVVPGGYRPGTPDQLQRDRARARLPLAGGHRIAVLGCTVGAGQTVTALMTGEVLARLRGDRVAVLDLNPGAGSLTERAQAVPALPGSGGPAPSRLEVISGEAAATSTGEDDAGRIFERLSSGYPLTLADPGAAAVPRLLRTAGQLVLVAPASEDAANAVAATREWLEAHGHGELADGAITVLNGVSRHTLTYVEQAEALARGRSRAIVRIPWDDRLSRHRTQNPGAARPASAPGPLSPAALRAYTALAGVLVAAVATGSASETRQRTRR